MGLVALHILVSLVLGDFDPRIQVIDVDLVIGDRHGNALAGVLRLLHDSIKYPPCTCCIYTSGSV